MMTKALLAVGLGLAFIGIFSALALSGILGTGFAISWLLALVIGVFGAWWVTNQFRRDWIFSQILGMTMLFLGIGAYILNIIPDIALILAVTGAFTLIFAFAAAFVGGTSILGMRGAGASGGAA